MGPYVMLRKSLGETCLLPERPPAYRWRESKSATTSKAGGLRKAPRSGQSHALLVVADFIKKEFWFRYAFV